MKRLGVFVIACFLASSALWAGGRKEEPRSGRQETRHTESSKTAAETEEPLLKIGTPNVVKSASPFGDYYLGIFAHISNPPLMKMNREGELVGQTAEKVEVSEDHRVWTFTIRDDLYWSDGTKLTPEDVRFSIEYTGKHNPNAGWIGKTLEKTEVHGNEVVLSFEKPYTKLRLEFATYNIFPKHLYEEVKDPMNYTVEGSHPGFGPFYIEEVDLNAGVIRFAKNPHWRGGVPEIDGYEIHIYKNTDVLSLALEAGKVHTYYKYASSYPYANIERLEKTGDFEFTNKLNMGLVFMAYNVRKGVSADPAFREALTYAIDYKEVLELDALGYGKVPRRGFVPPSMGGYEETKPLEYDPSESKRLLAEAGYEDSDGDGFRETKEGKELILSVLVRSDWSRVGELLQDYLQEVGIKANLRSLDLNGWVAAKDDFDYDVTVTRSTPWGMLMHAGWGTGYFDSRRTGRGVLHSVEDRQFLDLCDTILATADPEKLQELGGRAQDYYAEHLPAAPLYWNEIVTPFSKAYTGWKPDPLYGIYNIDTFLSVRKGGN